MTEQLSCHDIGRVLMQQYLAGIRPSSIGDNNQQYSLAGQKHNATVSSGYR